ncbi:MAG: hypothetical protein EHM93_04895 [Bacteroidales bacterium]|nr:MAG: hypothetical protein EHM93_04895 [Bacteroidales bacterium]
MKSHKIQDQYIIRSPLFSLNKWYDQFNGNYKENLIKLFSEPIIKEALFLGSFEFYNFLNDIENGSNRYDEKAIKKLTKYLSRLTYRCTPFGLFAGIDIGLFSLEETQLKRSKSVIKKRITKLDNNFLFSYAEKLFTNKEMYQYLIFYTNTSLYPTNRHYRYVEYNYNDSLERKYALCQIEKSEIIDELIEKAYIGLSYTEIIDHFNKYGADKEQAQNALEELLLNRILRIHTEPSVTNPFYLNYLSNFLEKNNLLEDHNQILKRIILYLSKADTTDDSLVMYSKIREETKNFQIKFNEKHLFQVDSVLDYEVNLVNFELKKEISEIVSFLSNIPSDIHNPINDFTESFQKRYENQSVSLSQVLDPNKGLGFPINKYSNGNGDFSPLLSELSFPSKTQDKMIKWDWFSNLMFKKYIDCIKEKDDCIKLSWNDIPFKTNHDNIKQESFSAMIQLIPNENKNCKIYCTGFGGVTAIPLLGRFAYLDDRLNKIIKEITQEEKNRYPDKIFAEVLHIPENRIGNILQHPPFYEYEIPFLSNVSVEQNNVIYIEDLFLKMRGSKLILYSKKLNKEIIPRLSNAHNYKLSSLPIYKFLCDYQHYISDSSSSGFFWPQIFNTSQYLPRVTLKNSILSKATWRISYDEIKDIYKGINKSNLEFVDWREKRKIPEIVTYSEGDNELILNLNEKYNILVFLDEIKKRRFISVAENLYSKELISINKRDEELFTNQIVVLFRKN